jgi:SNF2 family DNA or RNA helicase
MTKEQLEHWKISRPIKSTIALRDYQINIAYEALHKLMNLRIVYLSMQPRTGKTLTALATASILLTNKENVLFVTKKKAISSIEDDAKKIKHNFNLHVVNYESLHKLDVSKFDLIIADEAHCLGAFPKVGERWEKLKQLFHQHTFFMMLSGTPSPESYSQLFHQFHLSPHSPFNSYKTFYNWAKDFVTVKQKRVNNNMMINDYSDCNYSHIEKFIKPYFIDYTQERAGFEVKINEHIHLVEMLPVTYSLIKRLEKDNVVQGTDNAILADTKVKLMNKVHQLCSGTIIFESGESKVIDESKVAYMKNNFKNKKIAIFYKYKMEGELLKKSFENHTEEPTEFNNSDKIFIGQLQSVKEGVNLSTADAIVFYNIDFSSVTYQQARERSAHKDRLLPNDVHFIFSKGGIEEKIYKVLQTKQDFTTKHFTHAGAQISIEIN